MKINKHLKNLYTLSKLIGIKKTALFCLILGGSLMGFLELIGVMAIFPLMSMIYSSHLAETNVFLNQIKSVLHIEGKTIVTLFGVLIIGTFAVKNIFQVLYLRYEFNTLSTWRIQLAEKFFKHSILSDYDQLITRASSENISLITNTIKEAVSSYYFHSIQLLNLLITASILLTFLLISYTEVTLMVLVFGGSLIFTHNLFLKRKLKEVGMQCRQYFTENIALLQQSFKGIKETKIHLKEHYFINKFGSTHRQLAKQEQRLLFFQQLPSATTEFVMLTLVIVIFIYFNIIESSPQFLFAKLGTLTIIAIRMVPLINRSIHALMMLNAAQEPVENLLTEATRLNIINDKELMKNECSDPLPLKFEHMLKLANVCYRYSGYSENVINNVNLTISKGQFIGIVGPSGGGKSTLMDIVSGFLHPLSGEYSVDGTVITKNNVRSLRKLMGYVGQQIFLLNGTIAQNVAYGVSKNVINADKVIEALEKAKLWNFVKGLKNGIDTEIGEDGVTLSGGQRQRLSIARALYSNAEILILDEASATLDVETEHELFEYLYTLKGKLTVIIVAHRLVSLKNCDLLYFIDKGKIVDFGTHESLQQKNKEFSRYVKYSMIESTTHDMD